METPVEFVPPEHQLRQMSNAQLDRLLVRLFSMYIRLRDADEYGRVQCFSCTLIHHWTEMHCGHYAKRANMCTRFLEVNNNPQCVLCNITYNGNRKAYARKLDEKFGKGTAEYIDELSRKTCRWMRCDYIDAIRTIEKKLWPND
jgi:hypothetical protein